MRKHSYTTTFQLLAILLLPLVSRWIPENFKTKITINKDGSYIFAYNGTLTFGMALAAAQKGGLSARDEVELEMEGEKLRREPGFRRVDYQGKGRYKVLFEKIANRGEPCYFISQEMKFFAVVPQADRSIIVAAVRPSPDDIRQLDLIGATIQGTLSVAVASGVDVIKHNAESEPTFFGLIGDLRVAN